MHAPSPAPDPSSACHARPLQPGARACRLPVVRVALLIAVVMASGCSSMQFKRAAYQMLRQSDCRMNELDAFCQRNFTAEYHAYERVRRDFMRENGVPLPMLDELLEHSGSSVAGTVPLL